MQENNAQRKAADNEAKQRHAQRVKRQADPENQQKTGDSAKAKQSLNQAFIVCAGIPEEAVKVQLQNMIREKLNDL